MGKTADFTRESTPKWILLPNEFQVTSSALNAAEGTEEELIQTDTSLKEHVRTGFTFSKAKSSLTQGNRVKRNDHQSIMIVCCMARDEWSPDNNQQADCLRRHLVFPLILILKYDRFFVMRHLWAPAWIFKKHLPKAYYTIAAVGPMCPLGWFEPKIRMSHGAYVCDGLQKMDILPLDRVSTDSRSTVFLHVGWSHWLWSWSSLHLLTGSLPCPQVPMVIRHHHRRGLVANVRARRILSGTRIRNEDA